MALEAGAHEVSSSVTARPRRGSSEVVRQELRAEIDRLRATVAEQAVALHLHEGKSPWG